MGLHTIVRRGKKSTILIPHIHGDGCYIVSESRYEKDHIRIRSIDEVKEFLGRGYSLRMSNPEVATPIGHLIAPASIVGWR